MILENYKGCLLAAHPQQPESSLRRAVMLVIAHDKTGSLGLQLNKKFDGDLTMLTVMENLGLYSDLDQPLYSGGPDATNRIHVVHSLDWSTRSTIKVTNQLGVSNDISVLAAISENEGPEYFRVIAGYTRWASKHLEGEMRGTDPWSVIHTWSSVPANIENVFSLDDIDQWYKTIDDAGRIQIASWF
jgi:putative transcriptional regulator